MRRVFSFLLLLLFFSSCATYDVPLVDYAYNCSKVELDAMIFETLSEHSAKFVRKPVDPAINNHLDIGRDYLIEIPYEQSYYRFSFSTHYQTGFPGEEHVRLGVNGGGFEDRVIRFPHNESRAHKKEVIKLFNQLVRSRIHESIELCECCQKRKIPLFERFLISLH